MVFSSLEFLFLYLPVTLIAYFAVPPKHLKWRNVVLFVVSLIFYGWGERIYVWLMLGSIILSYLCGLGIDKYKNCPEPTDKTRRLAKFYMILAVVINISILGFFKYYDFFVTNLRLIPGLQDLPLLGLSLPIGISFYTFQILSYDLDLYMGNAKVQYNIASFGAYVTLFPQLIAGPIVRYQDVDDMLRERDENVALMASGLRTFIAGFGKKILLANTAGALWDSFKNVPADERTVVGCWLGIVFYTFQIYFDFSAYSDMAIGLGKVFSFKFLENFNYPYIAKSITDFWRRWHMSLSTWFREYIYFPLGGSRTTTLKTYRNLFIVWFCTGFWHGASWNYIIWGLYYFVLLVIEKAFLLKRLQKAPVWVQHVYTLFFVFFGWLIFVFEDSAAGWVWLTNMFGVNTVAFISMANVYDILRNLVFIAIMCIAATPRPRNFFYRLYEKSAAARTCFACASFGILVLGVAYLVDSSFNPFLYFRF